MMRCPIDWEIYRRPHHSGELGDRQHGCLVIPMREMSIIFSIGYGWEHVSVAMRTRCPTWDEMEEVKRRFWEPDDLVLQFHVPVSNHINIHPFCLHLWRPLNQTIRLPPAILVG